MNTVTPPSTTSSRFGIGCMILFALPFALVGIATATWMCRSVITWASMRGWVETPASLVSVNLEEHSGSDSTTYSVAAKYEYDFAGKHYTGTRVGIGRTSDNIGNWHRDVERALRLKMDRAELVPCYVNPHNPRESVLYRNIRWELIGFQSIFGVVFGLVGIGLIVAVLRGARLSKVKAQLRAENPDQPWLWNPAWRSGLIQSTSGSQMGFALFFAIFWSAVSFPIAFLIVPRELHNGNKAVLFVLMFPAVGIGLLIWAARAVIRWRKFGSSTFQMAAMPGVLGGRVAGAVKLPATVQPADGFHVTLSCVNKVTTGSGKSRSTKENILWQDEDLLRAEPLRENPGVAAVPVLFSAPFDMPASSDEDTDNQVIWRIDVKAAVPGVDYWSQFEIPVFKTPESSAEFKLDKSAIQKYEVKQEPEAILRAAGVRIDQTSAGLLSVTFPMAQRPGQALGVTMFFAIWTGAVIFMIKVGAPIVFPIIFGLFDVLIFYGVLDAWFGSAHVAVENGALWLAGGLFGGGKAVRLEKSEIQGVDAVSSGQQSNAAQTEVKVTTVAGKSCRAGRPFGSVHEAKALVDLIQQALR